MNILHIPDTHVALPRMGELPEADGLIHSKERNVVR